MDQTKSNESAAEITKERATDIAQDAVRASSPDADFVILPEKTIERKFGWVFFYLPRKYLESKNPGDLVPGAGPVVVHRSDGHVQFLPTSVDPDTAISEFQRKWSHEQRH